MEQLLAILSSLFPDALIYLLIAIVFIIGLVKCVRPVFRSAAALRSARETLEDSAKVKGSRPVWNDPKFLGKRLQPVWRDFLLNADISGTRSMAVDVAEYINEDTVVTGPGKAQLADVIPGLCTSLGILGTFIGLVMGLDGVDLMDMQSYNQLTGGIVFAFYTSIIGLVASFVFNTLKYFAHGRAYAALDEFTAAFYANGMPRPADENTQMLIFQRDQAHSLAQFAEDMSVRMAGEIQQAISASMTPVQRSMEDFLNAATRAQVDGLDFIVSRFIDRMNTALDGQLHRLGDALSQAADGQLRTQGDLRAAVESIARLSRDVIEVHRVSEQVIGKFSSYVESMDSAYKKANDMQDETADLLEQINQASARQARYLSALQEYQAKLQGSFQEYTIWTDKFVGGLEERTAAQNESLEQITMEMRASSELLRGAYRSFVESIELGLANALGLFDENMQNLTRQIHGTLSDIQETMVSLEGAMARAANAASMDREVS